MPRPPRERLICEWCGKPFPRPQQTGPKPRFCKPSHRQLAYEARRQEEAEARAKGVQTQLRLARKVIRHSTITPNPGKERQVEAALAKLNAA